MAIIVRRSNLFAPITDIEHVNQAWQSDADAITLDLEDGVVEPRKAEARGLVKEAIARAGKGGAEVFVRVNAAPPSTKCPATVTPSASLFACRRLPSAFSEKPPS